MGYTQFHKQWFAGTPKNANKASLKLAEGVADKEITVEYNFVGTEGNNYSVEVVEGSGNNVDMSAVLTDTKITVTLGTDGVGALDNTKNTATLIASEISNIDNFTATADGTGATAYGAAIAETNLTGGLYATPCKASKAIIILGGTWYIAEKPVDKWTVDGWKSANPTLI